MTTDPVRARWDSGEPAFAAWMLLDSQIGAETLAASGFDAVVLDLQHGSATIHELAPLVTTIAATPAVPFVRTAWNDPPELMRVLDLGVRGVICPMIGSREEAETLVRACRYPPEGARSYGPIAGAFGRGRGQTETANAAVQVFAMIETAEGLTNVDAIASTPGLDGLFAGPTDLGLSLGLTAPGDLTALELLGHLDAIVEAAGRHGIVAGVHAPDPPRTADMAGRGFRLISCAVDVELLREAGAEALRAARRPSQ